jgi:hypothetical protein
VISTRTIATARTAQSPPLLWLEPDAAATAVVLGEAPVDPGGLEAAPTGGGLLLVDADEADDWPPVGDELLADCDGPAGGVLTELTAELLGETVGGGGVRAGPVPPPAGAGGGVGCGACGVKCAVASAESGPAMCCSQVMPQRIA